MASKSERLISEALGHPSSGLNHAKTIAFTSTSAGVELQTNATYRFAADQDCFINIATGIDAPRADGADTPIFQKLPEIFTTTAGHNVVNVIRSSADGTLWLTLMHTRAH